MWISTLRGRSLPALTWDDHETGARIPQIGRQPDPGLTAEESSREPVSRARLESVRGHPVDLVVLPSPLGHLDADTVTDLRRVDRFVLELHRPDRLREVRRVPGDGYGVADVELTVGDVHDGDARLPEVVRHGSDELLPHGRAPLSARRPLSRTVSGLAAYRSCSARMASSSGSRSPS